MALSAQRPASHPDTQLFPDFDENLRQAMRRETELLFDTVIRQDRSALELLSAPHTPSSTNG